MYHIIHRIVMPSESSTYTDQLVDGQLAPSCRDRKQYHLNIASHQFKCIEVCPFLQPLFSTNWQLL